MNNILEALLYPRGSGFENLSEPLEHSNIRRARKQVHDPPSIFPMGHEISAAKQQLHDARVSFLYYGTYVCTYL
jgi:hypothetical protein